MQPASPSHTALRVALRRAAHQLYDDPLVFPDPFAVPILGPAHAQSLARTPLRADRPYSKALRAFLVARSRYAEDALHRAVTSGVRQYVLLGAGFDTFALRNPYPLLRVFELDHPATQCAKRSLLVAAGLTPPPSLSWLPLDLETEPIYPALCAAGFQPSAPAFVSWLGVTPYITLAAFRSTVSWLASLPPLSGFALDYMQPRHLLPPEEQLQLDSLAARVQLAGEPFQLFFSPQDIAKEVTAFSLIEDQDRDAINVRYFSPGGRPRPDNLQLRGQAAHLLTAWR